MLVKFFSVMFIIFVVCLCVYVRVCLCVCVPSGQLGCEIYRCSASNPDDCIHHYEVCNQSCTASYTRTERGNYGVMELGCGRGLEEDCSASTCLLNTSIGEQVIDCCCRGNYCNSIQDLQFDNIINVIHFGKASWGQLQ